MAISKDVRDMLSVREAAAYTGRHVETIRRWIKKGLLQAYRPGPNGNWLIKSADLDEALRVKEDTEKK